MDEAKADLSSLLQQDVVYDGEGYTRDALQSMVTSYQTRHKTNLKTLNDLSGAHDELAAEMTKDLVESKTAWEHVKKIVTFKKAGSNFRGLLEKIPLIRDTVPDRPINDLLEEKIEVAQRRVQQIGNYLDRWQQEKGWTVNRPGISRQFVGSNSSSSHIRLVTRSRCSRADAWDCRTARCS